MDTMIDERQEYEEIKSQVNIMPKLFKLDINVLKKTEGWIWKKGGINNGGLRRRNWKKRWFVLVEHNEDAYPKYELEYYTKPGGDIRGRIDLDGAEVFMEERNKLYLARTRFEWQILLSSGQTLLLASQIDEDDRNEWVDSINMIIAYLLKMKRASGFVLEGYDPMFEEEEDIHHTGSQLALNCQAYGPGLFGSEAGKAAKFVIQMHDLNGNTVDVGGMPFTATLGNEELLYHIDIHDNNNGSYSAHYVLKKTGIFQLRILLNDVHDIYGSPFEVEILPASTVASACECLGPVLSSIPVASRSSFTIIAKDEYGNQKPRGGDPFEVGVMGPATLLGLEDNMNGSYTCTIEGKTPEELHDAQTHSTLIMVTLHGKHVGSSPYQPVLDVDTYLHDERQETYMNDMNMNNNMMNNDNHMIQQQQHVPTRRGSVSSIKSNKSNNKDKSSNNRNPNKDDNENTMIVNDLVAGIDNVNITNHSDNHNSSNDATTGPTNTRTNNTPNHTNSHSNSSPSRRETEHEQGSIGASRLAKARQKVMAAKKMAGLSKFSSRLEANKRDPNEQ